MPQLAHGRGKILAATMPVEWIIFLSDNAPSLVLVQAEDLPGPKPNRENRLTDYRGRDALETAAVDGKLGFQDRVLMIQNSSAPGGNCPKRARRPCWRHIAEPEETLAAALYPEGRVRIEYDVLGTVIPEERE